MTHWFSVLLFRDYRDHMEAFRSWLFSLFFSLVLFAVVFLMPLSVKGEAFSVDIQEDQWSWESGSVASFSGQVTNVSSGSSPAQMLIEIHDDEKDASTGKIVFTSVNGKAVKARKQSSTVLLEQSPWDTISFTGIWYIPEDLETTRATLVLRLFAQDGLELGHYAVSLAKKNQISVSGGRTLFRLPVDLDHVELFLLVACGITWMLVLGILLFRSRKQR